MTRLGFLQGASASVGAIFGGSLFAACPGWRPQGRPIFAFGVVADTHIRTSPLDGRAIDKAWTGVYFESALKHFRERNVRAVVHCGDFAHLGQVVEMQAHAKIWRKVFPGNKTADGHEVAKLFVTGNHEFCSHIGGNNGAFVRRLYPKKKDWDEAVLQVDTARKWHCIWGEDYRDVWHREVGGFHFFGWQYGADLGKMAALLDESIKTFGLAKSDRPLFFVGHVPQGRPRRIVEVLKRHGCRNAVAFYGHNHYSAANLNTFANASDTMTFINVPCCAPWYGAVLLHDENVSAAGRIEGREAAEKPHSRQGLVVSLYGGMMVVERHDFGNGGKLGPDLMLPFGRRNPHPWSWGELKRNSEAPQFRKGARLEVGFGRKKHRRLQGEHSSFSPSTSGSLRIVIPNADGNPDSRVYVYEVAVADKKTTATDARKFGPSRLCKAVYAAGCNFGVGHEPDKGVTALEIPYAELPPGKTCFVAVYPLNSLGISGRPITACLKIGQERRQ